MIQSTWSPYRTFSNYQYAGSWQTYYQGVTYTGIAYGQAPIQDDWNEFANFMATVPGGQQYYGNDCSGFLSICWRLPARYTTSGFESNLGVYWESLGVIGSAASASYSMSEGDAFNSPNNHCVIFVSRGTTGVTTWEQTPDNAQQRTRTFTELATYRPIRRKQLSGTTPTVRTDSATSTTTSSAILHGTIISDGGSAIIRRQFGWGTDPITHSDAILDADISVSGNAFYATLSGLQPNTTYYFSAWAKNGVGWGNGNILSFTTANLPQDPTPFSKQSPSNGSGVTSRNVTLEWESSTDPGGGSITYDVTLNTRNDVLVKSWQGVTGTSVSHTIPNTWGSDYYWQVFAKNSSGSVREADGGNWHHFWANLPPGSMQFSASAYTVNENGGTVTITVPRTGGSHGAASVNYATSNGTATAGSDYTDRSGTLNWEDGDAASKTFTVPISDDAVTEGNETFTVNLSGATGASLGSPASTTVTIVDNDISISGYVRTPGGTALSGATMNGLPGNPTTGSSGYYSCSMASGWSGAATPTMTGFAFNLSSRSYSSVSASLTDQDYTGYGPTDSDGDGQTDLSEYVSGTDATDAGSTFALDLDHTENPPLGIVLSWDTVEGRVYTLRNITNLLNGGFWSNVTGFVEKPGTGSEMTYTNQTPGPTEFYRVILRRTE